jgi:hypothetical protein
VRDRVRGFWFLIGGACLAICGLAVGLTLVFTDGGSSSASVAGERWYSNSQACLLTGDRGLADPAAAPLWAGMQQASLTTHAKVSYLAVMGPQTKGNALSFLGSLLVRHCGVVLAAGSAQRDAVAARAHQYPSVKFAVVGGVPGASNVTVLSGKAAAIRDGAADEVLRATRG